MAILYISYARKRTSMRLIHRLKELHQSDIRALTFVMVISVAAAVGVCLLAPDSKSTEKSATTSRTGTSRGYTVSYAQRDEGHGDGSAADMRSTLAEKLFVFDPNTADSTTLLRLGLKPWQVRAIYRYRARGGRYYSKEGFARLPGLTLADYRRLEPYISIEKEVMAADVIVEKGGKDVRSGAESTALTMKESTAAGPTAYIIDKIGHGETIDINSADTSTLKRIPGIGSYFARKIVQMRQYRRLFTSPEELMEIDHFPRQALEYMVAKVDVTPIRVNTMTLQQLKSHPLLQPSQAREIERLRRTSGNIQSMADMSLLKSFTKDELKRIEPYMVFE